MKRPALAGGLAGFLATLAILLVLSLLVQVAVAVVEQRSTAHHLDQANADAVTLIARTLRSELDTVKGDARLFSALPIVRNFMSAPTPSLREAVERLAATLSITRGNYAQVRLIDNSGMEVLRVDETAHGLRTVPVDELQNKASRPYVTATAKLPDGAVYVSPLDLNIEHGQIQQPRFPTLRIGVPLFGEDGVRLGMVIINLDGNQLLADFHADAKFAHGPIWLVDREGNWLEGPDPSREWRFMTPNREQASVATDMPAVWAAMRSTARGEQSGSFGQLVFDTIDMNPSAGAAGPQLRIVSLTTAPALKDILLSRSYMLCMLILLPLLVILAAWLTHLRERFRVMHHKMRANAHLLDEIFQHSNLAMKVKDASGRILRINDVAAKLMGRPAEAMLGHSVDEVATAETAALIREHDREVLEGSGITAYEERVDYVGGSYTLFSTRFPVTDEHGAIAGIGVVSMDITPRIHMERALRTAKLEAESANRAKSIFLANMSHELRTPLNSIIGLSELTLEQAIEREDNEAAEFMRRVVNAGRHLLSLINDILDISRVESGRIELHAEIVRVDSLLESIVTVMQPLAKANRNRLLLELAPNARLACVDVVRLRQVVLNLIGNAIKFTRDGEVKVTLARSNDQLRITIADTGIGMTPDQLQRVFDPFEQADRSIARRFGGSGLGLTISRQLLELMGGQIGVTSDIHIGTEFTVTLPVGDIDNAEQRMAQAAEGNVAAHGRRPVVLVVDDDPDACQLIRNALERDGVSVISASSGEQALALTRSARPAVMVLDILLGDMSGWDVLAAVRADPEHSELPVIVCTVTDPEQRTGLLGVVEHLTKPFDRAHLSRLVQRLVGSAKSSQVLVVDDDDLYREKLAVALRQEGHWVDAAHDGQRALAAMRERVPDLVLLDLVMPGMDGLSVIEVMRADPVLAPVPIVLVTAADITPEMHRRLCERAVLLVRKGEGDLADIIHCVHRLLDPMRASMVTAGQIT
ncbi:response regulator [Dyella humi]|uniref:histidine kinase n=1 Tax=Dyella humi TaxID=1770547 RepID=A0ABW8IQ16_9GAMM